MKSGSKAEESFTCPTVNCTVVLPRYISKMVAGLITGKILVGGVTFVKYLDIGRKEVIW